MDMGAQSRARSGYAILWALMVIAIIAVIMAAAAPTLMQSNDVARVSEAAKRLKLVSSAVDSFAKYVRRGPGANGGAQMVPGTLTSLQSATAVVNAGASGCASTTYSVAANTNWTTSGPFTTVYMPPNGLWTPIGRVNDAVSGVATGSTSYDLTIPGVSTQDAQLLDQLVDGNQGSAADTVRYGAATAGTVTLTYRVFFTGFTLC